MKYAALALAGVYTIIYFWGGPLYANCACNAAGRKTLPYYFIGFAVLAAYYPLYLWRKNTDRKNAEEPEPVDSAAVATPGTVTPGGAGP
jgi:hypothetical protein